MRLIATLAAAALLAAAPIADARVHRRALHSYVATYAVEHNFSGAILVTHNGDTLYQGAFGSAERSFATPMRADARFPIASITKLFTATLILQLVDEGRLELDAPFGRYLPDYPGQGADRVTLRQLLQHTAGIAQFDNIASAEDAFANGIPNYQRPLDSARLLALCCSGALTREPGQSFEYNNADYFVLGRIIERITGQSFSDALRAHILAPLRLANTGMLRWDAPPGALVTTYFWRDDTQTLIHDMPVYWENWDAAGGMYSTTADLHAFATALYGGRLLSQQSLHALLTPGLDDYGLGLWSYTIERNGRSIRVAKRPGSIMGANAVLYVLPDDDLTIILLANTNGADLDLFAQRIADQFLADE